MSWVGLGCSQVRATAPITPVGSPEVEVSGARTSLDPEIASLPEEALGSQRLFRVRYQGPDGGGSLRLVLRLAEPGRFSLAASDALGRAIWSLALIDRQTLIVDHKLEQVCVTGSDVRVPEAALSALPVEMLPLVLLGRFPIWVADAEDAGDPETATEVEVFDRFERRWTARLEGGEVQTWTLWKQDEPSLWWLAQSKGGVLSYRGGSQFRWRQTVVESLPLDGERLEPPAGYAEVSCDGWGPPEP